MCIRDRARSGCTWSREEDASTNRPASYSEVTIHKATLTAIPASSRTDTIRAPVSTSKPTNVALSTEALLPAVFQLRRSSHLRLPCSKFHIDFVPTRRLRRSSLLSASDWPASQPERILRDLLPSIIHQADACSYS